MTTIETELTEIRSSFKFKKGFRYFWLYNYSFFKILDETEFEEYNRTPLIEGKKIFAAGSTNPDDDEYYLLYDKQEKSEIYIRATYKSRDTRGLKKIGNSLSGLFDGAKVADSLIPRSNEPFAYWSEALYSGSPIEENVPKGVLPLFDLRHYFKYQLKDTILSNPGEFDTKELKSYFENHGAAGLMPADFAISRPAGESYLKLVKLINEKLKEEVFFATELHTSGHCGIGKYSSLTADERKMTDYYGLILPKT